MSGRVSLTLIREVRLPSGRFARSLRSLSSCHFSEHGTEALHGTIPFLLLLFHHLLLVGFLLVTNQFGCHRVGHFRVEALRLFLLFFLRWSENEPHGACKKQEHQGINDKLLSPL